ncbi:MAG TPA: DUF1015 family protein [Candidatus Acidoferrales bacterium]|jgi:uncharacterized protein (DUF1015 family)|nr:DUF1015 family protein [Candidatus Acidoferrales bacterium]
MATLKPFAALRPKPELAAQICELPYDVMSSDEARVMAAGNPLSFLHVSKPEIDLPADTDIYSSAVYAKGKENFSKLIAQGAFKQDEKPNFYLYRQVMGQHAQTGLVAAASCEEYLANIIKKHEFTRPDKEDDRVRHIEALNSQTGPVFLTYRAVAAFDEFVAKKTDETPAVDFTGKDGVRHTSWAFSSAEEIAFVEAQFAAIPFLYIADGHHRSAAAGRVFQSRNGAGHSGQFLTVIFPHNQMQILPYNRVLKDLNGLTPQELMKKLEEVFNIVRMGVPTPTAKHELGLFINKRWHTLTFKAKLAAIDDPIEKLDVTLLQKNVLAPVFGIDDPRTSKKINFVGGIRGTAELEKLVNSGEYACAFSMFPTSIEDLMTIADAGGIMPPKSTWFEPKLRDAMFCHMI